MHFPDELILMGKSDPGGCPSIPARKILISSLHHFFMEYENKLRACAKNENSTLFLSTPLLESSSIVYGYGFWTREKITCSCSLIPPKRVSERENTEVNASMDFCPTVLVQILTQLCLRVVHVDGHICVHNKNTRKERKKGKRK